MTGPNAAAPPPRPGRHAGTAKRRGRRVVWLWAVPGILLLALQIAYLADVHRLAQSVALYSERAWPSLKLEWQVRRHVLPALERRDPDAALRALDEVRAEADLFEDRVTPLRIRAWLEKDDIHRALSLYAHAVATGSAEALPASVHEALGPHLERLRAGRRDTKIAFEDATAAAGVRFEHMQRGDGDRLEALYQAMGSGLAVVDLDGDDWLDLFFVGGRDADPNGTGNRLFRNRGDGRFEDVTAGSGLEHTGHGFGVAAADLDGDLLPELYVTSLGSNHLFHNRGGMRFEDVTSEAGVAGRGGASTGAAFGDVDGDGDLDLYVAQWVRQARQDPDRLLQMVFGERSRLALFAPHMYPPDTNQLFLNQGNLGFVDATESAGLADPQGRGLGVVLTDLDGDRLPDLFVANDVSPNRLFLNRGGGRFEDVSAASRMLDARAGMGIAVADWDADGAQDLFYTNFRTEYNALVLNRLATDGFFSEQTHDYGLAAGSLGVTSWGVVAEDLDNDGDLDLAIVNGHPTPFDPDATAFQGDAAEGARCLAERPLVYERRGERFVDVTPAVGDFGSRGGVGRGLVAGDLDRDGRLDLVASHNNGPARVQRNVSPTGAAANWLVVRARWQAPNRLAVGARVRLETGSEAHERVVLSGSSYLSQAPFELHFGLGAATRVERILVTWPDGSEQEVRDVAANQVLEISPLPAPRVDGRTATTN